MKKSQIAFLCMLIIVVSCKKESPPDISGPDPRVEYLPGPCPYDCHDSRCTAYLNGYCGVSGTAPDMLATAQFISQVGIIHNNALTYGYYNANRAWTDGYAFANNYMNVLANYYSTQLGGMTVPFRTEIVNFAGNIFSNYAYYGTPDGFALDQLITSQINQIAASRSLAERNLLMSALTIYHFNINGMTVNQMFDTIIARCSPLLTQYNRTSWPQGTGDCVGGYLQIVYQSANYWKYVNLYGVPPPGGGGSTGSVAVSSVRATAPNLNPVKEFFRFLAWPELDAGAYLWGWGKSYFGGEQNMNKRIKTGLTAAAETSFGRWVAS